MRLFVIAGLLGIALIPAHSQTEPAQAAYTIASVKPNSSGSQSTSSNQTRGRIIITNRTLKALIERAYLLKPFQVIGPPWLDDVRFDIIATFPPDTQPAQQPLMLRSLLEDRFHLGVHRETKEMPGYALVVAKDGPRLKAAAAPGGHNDSENGGLIRTLVATSQSTAFLADFASRNLDRMVVDRTNLTGSYDFELRWASDDLKAAGASDSETAPSLFTAFQETLGLRLQSEKVPVSLLVIDRADRVPAEN